MPNDGEIMFTHTLPNAVEIILPDKDIEILHNLAERIAMIAALAGQEERKRLWRDVNDLSKPRPAVLIRADEVPWHEMGMDDELALKTTHGFSRSHEEEFRRILYQWEHMRCDMVVEPVLYSPIAITDTGFGIQVDEDLIAQSEAGAVISHHYKPHIRNEKDLEKIRPPEINILEDVTEGMFDLL